MSYQLAFWKQSGPARDPYASYTQLCQSARPVPGIEAIPMEGLLRRVAEVFPQAAVTAPTDETSFGSIAWRMPGCAFEGSWTTQCLIVACHGLDEASTNRLIDVAIEFGCRLYDPQKDRRFDSV